MRCTLLITIFAEYTNRLESRLRWRLELRITFQEHAKTREAVGEVKQAQAPRHLTEEQKKKLIPLLAKIPPTALFFIWTVGMEDGVVYSNDFIESFRAAGWSVGSDNIAQGVFTGHPLGIIILVKNPMDETAAKAAAIQRALKDIGIAAMGSLTDEVQNGQIRILIAHKS